MEVRGIPGAGRVLALPLGSLTAAALAGGLAWTVVPPERWLRVAALSVAIFGGYELVRSHRLLSRHRRAADDWLRTATGRLVPPAHAWRAEQLCSPRQRRMLARTLRRIETSAYERPVRRSHPRHLPAVREHRTSIQRLARVLESLEVPVTPAGMLHVVELVTDGTSPLWGTTRGPALGDAIRTTLALLSAGSRGSACAA
jgi:hypothetical protein